MADQAYSFTDPGRTGEVHKKCRFLESTYSSIRLILIQLKLVAYSKSNIKIKTIGKILISDQSDLGPKVE